MSLLSDAFQILSTLLREVQWKMFDCDESVIGQQAVGQLIWKPVIMKLLQEVYL